MPAECSVIGIIFVYTLTKVVYTMERAMKEVWKTVQDMYLAYQGENTIPLLVFWVCSILILFEKNRKENKVGHALAKYILLFIGIAGCPITAYIIMKYCVGKEVYWRMLWLLPIPIVIAYTGTKILGKVQKKAGRLLALGAMTVALLASGISLFTEANFSKSTNRLKLPDTVITVCDYLEADAKEQGITEICAIVTPKLMCYIRQYNGKIKLAFGREAARGKKNNIYEIINTTPIDCKKLAKAAKKRQCNYLIYEADAELDAELKKNQFEYLANIDEYKVYRFWETD